MPFGDLSEIKTESANDLADITEIDSDRFALIVAKINFSVVDTQTGRLRAVC